MPSNDKQKWHGADQSDNDDLTVRHPGPHFQAIRSWAEQNNVSDIFDALIATMAGELEGTGVTANVLVPGGPTNTNLIGQDTTY